MAITYDTETGSFAATPDFCDACGSPLYDTGCNAPGCLSRCCMDCGTGCDIEIDPEHGTCATALAEEDDEDYGAPFAAERAAFGLPPLRGE